MKFTEEQRNKINLHIDSIYSYLLNLQDSIHEPIDINLENSSISSFSLTHDNITLSHNSNWLTPIVIGSTPVFGKSIYEKPQVGYDLLLNWQIIKEKLLAELNEQQVEYSQADDVINNFVV